VSIAESNYPEALVLQPGDSVDGTFVRLERGTTRSGEPRAIAVLKVDGVERSLWLHETALRAKFRDLQPESGERITIAKGAEKKQSENGERSYWPFVVEASDREPEQIGWDDHTLAGDAPEDDDGVPF
jgi:hypothetical protein